jgi:undecaprenyl-diphosphatase
MGISWTCAPVRTGIQWVVSRPRPNPLLVRISHDKKTKSFPSGHVSSSVVFWGWLVALGIMLRKGMPYWQRALVGIPALFVAVVGPSRVYLGDHWPTDVLGGYLFGGGWLGLSLWLYLELRNRKVLAQEEQEHPK